MRIDSESELKSGGSTGIYRSPAEASLIIETFSTIDTTQEIQSLEKKNTRDLRLES